MNKRIMILPLLILMAMIIVSPAMAQKSEPIEVSLQVQEGVGFTVGDPIPLTLEVRHPAGYHVIQPELDEAWGDFVVHSQSPATTVDNGDGTESTSQVIDVRIFAPGEFSTPSMTVKVSDGNGGLLEVTAESTTVHINSVLVEGDNQLRDIKPQAELPYKNFWPWIIAVLLIGLSLVGFFYLWRRKRVNLATAPLDNRLPHEVALDQLNSIEGLRLPDRGRYKEHYTLVSDCIRIYMERRYQIPVLERTTAEIQASMKIAEIHPEIRREFIELLTESDLVKFAKFTPGKTDAKQIIISARHIVEVTKPFEVEVESAGEGDSGTSNPDANQKMPQSFGEGKEAVV
jgi:hypothetical protein